MRLFTFLLVAFAFFCFPAFAEAAAASAPVSGLDGFMAGALPIASLVAGVITFALGIFHSLGASRAFSQHLRDQAAADPKSLWSPIEVALAQHIDAGDDVALANTAKTFLAAKQAAHGPAPSVK